MNGSRNLLYLFSLFFCLFIGNVVALESEAIIGGDDAEEGQFKYQISLQVYGQSICGGSIIAEHFVLTAAHCVTEKDGSFSRYTYKVVAGTSNLAARNGKPVTVDVEAVYVPRRYKTDGSLFDIAVLKLKQGLGLKKNSELSSVDLPTSSYSYAGVKAVISGFGWNKIRVGRDRVTGEKKELGGSSNRQLKFAEVNILSTNECRRTNYPDRISSIQICGQVRQRNIDGRPEGICSGDSGGPLVFGNTVIGVVSVSPIGCEETEQAAAYTRVSSFVPFIKSVMSGHTTQDVRVRNIRSSGYSFFL